MEVVVEPLGYPDTLVEKMEMFTREITKKNDALAMVYSYLFKVETTLEEVN